MRSRALALILMVSASSLSAECITVVATARHFFANATAAARAIGGEKETLVVTESLLGKGFKPGDAVPMPQRGCCPGPIPGVEYYLVAGVVSGQTVYWRYEVARADRFMEYLGHRHLVTRAAAIERFHAWQRDRLATDQLRSWLETAYTEDNDDGASSLTMVVIDEIIRLLDFLQDAESCAPGQTPWLKEFGAQTLAGRFDKLTTEEKRSDFEKAHPDDDDGWDDALSNEIDSALEADPEWKRTGDCIDSSRRSQNQR